MADITVCPQCQTRFRVTEEQLKARKGHVRCGRCNHIFNARETLLDETPEPESAVKIEVQAQAPQPEEMIVTPPVSAQEIVSETTAAETIEHQPQEPAPPETREHAQPETMNVVSAYAESAPPESGPKPDHELKPDPKPEHEVHVIRVQPPAEKEQPRVSPNRPKYGPPPKPKRAWPWVLASLLLLLVLAGQGIYFFRDAIAANYPPIRPVLENACTFFQCEIKLPRNPDLISIESSELHADPARAYIVVLTSTLRNGASHAQAYPTLELTLTNARDEMVARRLFLPSEYVRPGKYAQLDETIAQGIPAKSEVAVKLLMDMGELKAEGYRLYLFYPS